MTDTQRTGFACGWFCVAMLMSGLYHLIFTDEFKGTPKIRYVITIVLAVTVISLISSLIIAHKRIKKKETI